MLTMHGIGLALVIFTAVVTVFLIRGANRIQKLIEAEKRESEEL